MIHHSSDVHSDYIGSNTSIWQFCVVLSGAFIGDDCNINAHVFIENDVVVGNRVTVKSGVQLWDGIRIEDDVFIGPNVTFTNDNKPRSKQYPETFAQTIVRKGASIGANSTILPNIEIGEFALIGAGSVVTKKVLPQELVVGNPAKRVGWVNKNGDKLIKLEDNIWKDEFFGEIFEETPEGLIKG
jgi:UDP-2-acetamido-3-amino-2,3-dideoxy-glucuronate N-acetyltransferase